MPTDAPDARPLFVYGTLLFPEVLEALLARVPASEPATLGGWRAAALEGRPYPGLVRSEGHRSVKGRLFVDLSPEERQVIADFEGNLYDLVEVVIDGLRSACAYAWRHPSAVLDHDWDPDHFAAVDLPDFLNG